MSLSPTPRLLIRRPSPTTVSFTVSNLPNHSRMTSLLITIPILLLRSLLGVFTLFVNWAKYSSTIVEARFPLPLPITTAQNIIATTSFGRLAAVVAERIKWPVLLPISAAISYLVIARFYTGTVIISARAASGGLVHVLMLGLVTNRGVSPGPPWPGYPDLDFLLDLPRLSEHAFYPNERYPGHLRS